MIVLKSTKTKLGIYCERETLKDAKEGTDKVYSTQRILLLHADYTGMVVCDVSMISKQIKHTTLLKRIIFQEEKNRFTVYF